MRYAYNYDASLFKAHRSRFCRDSLILSAIDYLYLLILVFYFSNWVYNVVHTQWLRTYMTLARVLRLYHYNMLYIKASNKKLTSMYS